MGQYAEENIDYECGFNTNYSFRYSYDKYYIRPSVEKKIRKVRQELTKTIQKFKEQNIHNPEQNARKWINAKYGRGWRERGIVIGDDDQWKSLSEYKDPIDFVFDK